MGLEPKRPPLRTSDTATAEGPWPPAGSREAPERATEAKSTTRSFIRGSSLLLSGRALSLGTNFLVQVLTVRYLSKSDYGAFAYALGVVSMGATAVLLGLHRAIPRFAPIYRERGELRRMFGAIALATLTVVGLGVSLVLLVHGLQGTLLGTAVGDPLSLAVLLVLIALTPLEALDYLLQGLLATFAGAKAVFFRRHVLTPGLRLGAVLLVIGTAGDVHMLAWAYVAGGLIGVTAYAGIVVRTWKKQGLLARLRSDGIEVPAREIFGYSLPLLSSEVMVILKSSFVVVLLELLQTTTAVAEYRAILPLARLNLVALSSFSLLFIPVASKLFAQDDRESIHDLFWQTSTWVAVLTFPVLALTTSLAGPLAVLLFGSTYAGSGDVLAVLALGFYFHAALGANTSTLRVFGSVRFIVVTDVVAIVAGVAAHLLLIPRYGALGAAAAASGTMILHNALHHVGLSLAGTGIRLLEPRYVRVYGSIFVALVLLLVVDRAIVPPIWVSVALIAGASLAVLRLARTVLRAETTFPELLRVPLLGRILS